MGATATSAPLVSVRGVAKKYATRLKHALRYGVGDVVREVIGRPPTGMRLRAHEFVAVDAVSFELGRGDSLGIIGPNGAGKSTLLKLLTGVVKPDAGAVTMRGRVGALIELGAGFSPVLTGRENVYLNAAIHGIGRSEMDRLFESIVEFAEVGPFIDAPLRTYSSGMKVRLGFALATALRPDVLLIDEVLAVGDAGFRAKCYNRIAELAESAALILVSHNMAQIARLAERTLVLDHGRAVYLGPSPEAIGHHHDLFTSEALRTRSGDGRARIDGLDIDGVEIDLDAPQVEAPVRLTYGAPVTLRLRVHAEVDIPALVVDLVFRSVAGEIVAQCNNYVRAEPLSLRAGEAVVVEVRLDALTLNPGGYVMAALLMSGDMTGHYDWLHAAARLRVDGGRPAAAGQQFLARWGVRP